MSEEEQTPIPAPINQKKIWLTAGIGLIVILVMAGSAMAYVGTHKNTEIIATPMVTASPTPSPTASPVAVAPAATPIPVIATAIPTAVITTTPKMAPTTPKPVDTPIPAKLAPPLPTIMPRPTLSPSLDRSVAIIFSNPRLTYTFNYPTTYTYVTWETGTYVTDQVTNPSGNTSLSGTTFVSVTNYSASSSESHLQQVSDLITARGATPTPITIHGFSGFSMITNDYSGTSISIFLAGSTQILQVSCIGSASVDSLTTGQAVILNSIGESRG